MDTLTSYLGWNAGTIALIVVLALIIALMAFRAVGGRVRGGQGARLGISEYHEIDKMRRLVLVRRDGVEHLLMIGGAQDLVIESGIGLSAARDETYLHRAVTPEPAFAPPPRSLRDDDERDDRGPMALRAAPRPAVFGERRPVLKPVNRDEPRLTPAGNISSQE
jgi:hypothetical protein